MFNEENTPQEKIVIKYLKEIIFILQPYYGSILFVGRGSRFCSTWDREQDNLAIRYTFNKVILEKLSLFFSCKVSTDLILEVDLSNLLNDNNLKIKHTIPEERFSLIKDQIDRCQEELLLCRD